jgi:hypothetical protein
MKMWKNLTFIILILLCSNIKAQKINVSYGGLFGINTSFMDSKINISEDILNYDPTLRRNISLSKTSKANFGYNLGVFAKLQPENSRFSFESRFLISQFNNRYTILTKREDYYKTSSSGHWNSVEETEEISNEFTIINIPLTAEYDFCKKNNKIFTLFCGLAPNINVKDGHTKKEDIDNNDIPLYKSFFFSYQSGISMSFNKIVCDLKYERSLDIKKPNNKDYFQPSMDVKKFYINSISLSVGIKLN